MRHLRRGDQIIQLPFGMCRQLLRIPGGTDEGLLRRGTPPLRVVEFYLLHDLEQPRAPRYAERLERGRNGQANGLFRSAGVCHDQVRAHRVQPAVDALDGGIEGFEVNGDVSALFHDGQPPFKTFMCSPNQCNAAGQTRQAFKEKF